MVATLDSILARPTDFQYSQPNMGLLGSQNVTSGAVQGAGAPLNAVTQGAMAGAQNPVNAGVAGVKQGADYSFAIQMANSNHPDAKYWQGILNQKGVPYGQQGAFDSQGRPITGANGALSMSGQSAAQGATSAAGNPSGGGFTTIGQMSPEEQARNARIMGSGGAGGGSGGIGSSGQGMAGGGSSGAQPTTGGLNLAGVNGGAGQANGGNPAFVNTPSQTNPTLSYEIPNSPTVGYSGTAAGQAQGQQGVLQMQNANPQSALGQYQNTPGYQLLNSPGAYQASPGYQYAMDQALGQVQNNASARGMLESGAVLKSMQQTASGLAQQDYGNWWNRQSQLYGDYQNRLQGLAGGPTGSQDAMTTGANLAQGSLQTGSNLGSLFGNQGSIGMGGIVNTGAAQSNNMTNAGVQQAQVGAANQSTQLAGATLASNQQKGLF